MGITVDSHKVVAGNVVHTTRGNMIVTQHARYNRRNHIVLEGVYEKDLPLMLKNAKNTKFMKFIKWTLRRAHGTEVIGTVPKSTVTKLREMHVLLTSALETKRLKNMDALDLKWNSNAVVKKTTKYGGTKFFRGTYDVTTMKDEHVSAGDRVMVHFANGNFEMSMGNESGITYDGKTGRFLCMDPWKVGRTKQRFDYVRGRMKTTKSKARSMPPESLLYLIAKKGTN
jgi:hypothetical protein